MVDVLRGLLGVAAFVGLLYLFSTNRRAISWRLVATGVLLQVVVGFAILRAPFISGALDAVTNAVINLLGFADRGGEFIFGSLYDKARFGYIFIVNIVPTIIFFSALTSILYYLGILQKVVFGLAWVMQKTMRLSGAESLAAAANIFIGQTEAPLVVKPYIGRMTSSELFCLMTGGMATIAGGVFGAYVGFLGGEDREMQLLFGKHLLTASLLSAPAAIVAAKMLLPETEVAEEKIEIDRSKLGVNVFDSAMQGATQGLYLAFNVMAALIAFIGLIALLNAMVGTVFGEWCGLNSVVASWTDGAFETFNLNFLFGVVFAPIAWLMGVDSESILFVGQLLGEKLVLNEFVAYGTLAEMKSTVLANDERAVVIAAYALCGFANFSSIGIQIGGISALAPEKRGDLARLALRSVLGGTMACFMTAAVAAMLIT
jgi:CNT family concentrative nucleoside transporter